MAEEIDDNEFFQQDFTTASEWEIFNARLDEIFQEWKLPYIEVKGPLKDKELFLADWEVKTEPIFFADVELTVSRHCATFGTNQCEEPSEANKEHGKVSQAEIDLMTFANSFDVYDDKFSKVHPLARWYGLRDFVIIEPIGRPIINESQIRVLLSSACITVAEVDTQVPVFIRIMYQDLHVYLGVSENPSMRINFDIVALETTPPTCKNLVGLLSMFKAKVGNHYVNPVTVSIQFTYSLIEFLNSNFTVKCKIPFSNDLDEEEEFRLQSEKFYALPYGVSIDPVSELILHCTWPEMVENLILDSASYSGLDPILCPSWSVRLNFKRQPLYFLTDTILEYAKLAENTKTLASIVGSSYEFGSTMNLEGSNPLDLLTESKIPGLTSVLPVVRGSEAKKSKAMKENGPIKEEELMQMLYYMFPDAQQDPNRPYEVPKSENFDPLLIKSATPDSLVFRLGSLLAICNSYFGGVSAVAHLWAEFTQEMRYRVERCIQIPGVAVGFPDSRSCLLHQKLQMLNICMERRRLREGGLPFSVAEGTSKPEKDDSEDEFFDCATDEEQEVIYPPWNKPQGRLSQLGKLKLINSSEPLYVPVTQDPVPKTEDQLEDDAEVMLKLGPGSELCTQMMSASLFSDMESFKAANPNGKLEDFIRWYSPRDWIEEADENGDVKGRLSERMMIPGNTWQTVWSQSKPVPAKRQRRLFDDTKEVEKVLHFFETRTIGQICQLTLAPLYHAAMLKIKTELRYSNFMENFSENFEKVMTNLCKLSRENWVPMQSGIPQVTPSHKKWEAMLQEISNLDQLTIQAKSIALKLFGDELRPINEDEKKMVVIMLKGMDVDLPGGAKNDISVRILGMFSDARQSKDEFNTEKGIPSQLYLPEPIRKEYILRLQGKTVGKVAGGPQFLRAVLDKHMRLCGAFSTNTTFV